MNQFYHGDVLGFHESYLKEGIGTVPDSFCNYWNLENDPYMILHPIPLHIFEWFQPCWIQKKNTSSTGNGEQNMNKWRKK